MKSKHLNSTHRIAARWPLLVLGTGTVVGGSVAVYRLQESLRAQLPAVLRGQVEGALGRPVEFGALHFGWGGVWVESFRVPRRGDEVADLLAARRLWVGVEWSALLFERQVRVSGIELEGAVAHLSSRAAAPGGKPWSAHLAAFSRAGVDRIGLKDAVVQMDRAGERAPLWAVAGIRGELRLRGEGFRFEGQAKSYKDRQFALAGVRMKGDGDAAGLRVASSEALFEGRKLKAAGTVVPGSNGARVKIHADRLPLARLAPHVGLPAEWAVAGHVTGEVEVDARNNALHSVIGTVSLDRGSVGRSESRFPWESASARLVWTPAQARLDAVRIQGAGLTLTGSGRVETRAGQPFTAGRFGVAGTLTADRVGALKQVAGLLAFQDALGGRWSAGGARIQFDASGVVRDLARAQASGRLDLTDLRFRPAPDAPPVTVSHLAARVRRSGDLLELSDVTASVGTLQVKGQLSVTDDVPGRPGTLRASGTARVPDLDSLRAAVPDAALWKWIPSVTPEAGGRLGFEVSGPARTPSAWNARGAFELSEFRFAATSPLPSGAVFYIPVKSVRGDYAYAGHKLAVSGLELNAGSFQADGDVDLLFSGRSPRLQTHLAVRTDDWRSLPAMQPDVLPELQGGHLEATLQVEGNVDRLAQAPVLGAFRLTGAQYRPANGARPVPVRDFSTRFRWADRRLELPALTLESPTIQAQASGEIVPRPDGYQLQLEVSGWTGDAGDLVSRYYPQLKLAGGTASVRMHVDAPMSALPTGRMEGTLSLKGGEVHQAIEQLGRKSLPIRAGSAVFTAAAGHWDVQQLSVSAPGVEVALQGAVSASGLDAQANVTVDEWIAPAAVPVSGGEAAVNGRLRIAFERPQEAEFTGEVKLGNATPRLARSGAALRGGRLELTARGEGRFGEPMAWVRSGEVRLADTSLELPKLPLQKVASLGARFEQVEGGFRIADATVEAPGYHLAGSGNWSDKEHRLALSGSVTDPTRFGLSLPAGVRADRYYLTASIAGTAETPVLSGDGTLAADRVHGRVAGKDLELFRRLEARFQLGGERLALAGIAGEGPLGTLAGDGDWSADGHRLNLTWAGESLAAAPLDLPKGVASGPFRIEAVVTGSMKVPVVTLAGKLTASGVRLPFGAEASREFGSVTARFAKAGEGVRLEQLAVEGPAGHLAGTGSVDPKGYEFQLTARELQPSLVAGLLPGRVEEARVSGTLAVSGSLENGPSKAGGRFEVAAARYFAPAEAELADRPLRDLRATGDYRWQDGVAELTRLELTSTEVAATGRATVRSDGTGLVTAQLRTSDLGRVADYWPVLQKLVRGGAATGQLDLTFNATGSRGRLALKDQGGSLFLASAPAEFAEHPVETAELVMDFSPDRLQFSGVKIRGPKGNLDGSGVWTASGPVSGEGKAWFSKSHTSKLLKPTGVGWLAKLFGLREIKSDFKLSGTADRVLLNAGITRSFMWKLAKGQVPKEFQQIAAGKSPLYVKPLEVVQAPKQTQTPTAGPD